MIRDLYILLIVFFLIVQSVYAESFRPQIVKDECGSLDECIDRVNHFIDEELEQVKVIDSKTLGLIERLQDFDDIDVIEVMIPLLKHQDTYAKDIAANLLARINSMDDQHFDALTEAMQESHNETFKGQLLSSLANIESDRATDYAVKAYLSSNSKSYFEHQALGRLGDRVVPYLEQIMNDDEGFYPMSLKGDIAPYLVVKKLLEETLDTTKSDKYVIDKLLIIGRMGLIDDDIEQLIQDLQLLRPGIDEQVFEQLYINIGDIIKNKNL